MPGGDGTGPMGMGPMSGRGAGNCAGYPVGFRGCGGGRRGGGRGGRHGRRNMFWATGLPGWARAGWVPTAGDSPPFGGAAFASMMSRDVELQVLERQADYFGGVLDRIQKRLEELRSAHAAEAGDKK